MHKPVINTENVKASWFEFLLDPVLLKAHLEKDDPDPSCSELIIHFLVNSSASTQNKDVIIVQTDPVEETGDNFMGESKKSLSLKILAYKTFSFVKWDLNFLMTKLPVTMQYTLLSTFLNMVLKDAGISEIPDDEKLDFTSLPNSVIFALTLYHRWCVAIIVKNSIPVKPPRTPAHMLQVPGQNNPTVVPPAAINATIVKIEEKLPKSVDLLESIFSLNMDILVPTIQTFGSITEETVTVTHNWTVGEEMKQSEFLSQIGYDLACYYFFQQQYNKAFEKFTFIRRNIKDVENSLFCFIDMILLNGYCEACSKILNYNKTVDSMTEKVKEAAANESTSLVDLMLEDFNKKALSNNQREKIETDLMKLTEKNSFQVFQVRACNAILQIADGQLVSFDLAKSLRYHGDDGISFFVQSLKKFLPFSDHHQMIGVKSYIRQLCMSEPKVLNTIVKENRLMKLFSDEELTKLLLYCNATTPPHLKDEFSSSPCGPTDELYKLQDELILSYELEKIEKLLQDIKKIKNSILPWTLNRKWNVPQPLENLVKSINPGFIQDMSYVVLAKALELRNLGNYDKARSFYHAVETECRPFNYQISQLIRWEMLLMDLLIFNESEKMVDIKALKQNVKQSIMSFLQDKGDPLPRHEILENFAVFLLNVQDWDFLNTLGMSRSGFIEFSKLLAAVCQEMKGKKGNKGASQELWSIVLPIFNSTQSQYKRSHTGAGREQQREAPHSILTKIGLMLFLDKITDPVVLSLMISCLSKLFNLLKDDGTYNLHLEHENLWTGTLQNTNSLNLDAVKEILEALLKHSLEVQSSNPNWLRSVADLSYAHGYYFQAIKYYLKAGIVVSDYFSNPIPKQLWTDQVHNRLIRCCTHLHCYTQAAVFCQFTAEIDYAAAFKWLGERPCSDSCDSYYKFIWDITMLEYLVNLHAKRAEVNRRQLALSSLGLLELNSNNNEEILRNAAELRKTRFLISMAKQYL